MIMNIESFNISKNVLYKLINKINPVRFRAIAGGLALLFILALPGCSLLEPEKMPPKPANPTGVSGKHDPQAEQLFAKAHVLWKGETWYKRASRYTCTQNEYSCVRPFCAC